MMTTTMLLLAFLFVLYISLVTAFTIGTKGIRPVGFVHHETNSRSTFLQETKSPDGTTEVQQQQQQLGDGPPPQPQPSAPPSPTLNGKRVLPYKIMSGGLKGQNKVSAVYAILNSGYKRGYAGWENCEHVGVSMDLDSTLKEHLQEYGSERVAHVRALSFQIPSEGAMEDVAEEWRREAKEVGGLIDFEQDKDETVLQAIEQAIPYDDDDEEEDEEFMEMRAEALAMARGSQGSGPQQVVVSPFDSNQQPQEQPDVNGGDASTTDNKLAFTKENVDKVLDEVRPYLISDGGNVSVERVDEQGKDVYLKLEGACGSCASSTVTMQMGIERVLKENFEDLNQVLQVEDEEDTKPNTLTVEAVEGEVNRIKPAIIALGGGVQIVKVDSDNGSVVLKFRGASKVRQGLEMAIMDMEFVNQVEFEDWED